MKKFLTRFLYFALPIIILAYPADAFISNGLKHSTLNDGEMETWRDIYDGNINSDCVICGSSRAWVHFDPKILADSIGGSVYNLGIDAHNFHLQDFRLKELLKHNSAPKTIIYNLDMSSLQKRADLYNYGQFLPFMLWNKDMEEATSSYQGFKKSDYIVPLLRYVGNFQAIKSGVKYYIQPDDRLRYKGYKGMNLSWNKDLDIAMATRKSFSINLDSTSVRKFEDFIKETKKNDLSLILVYSPEQIEGNKLVSNRDSIMNMYRHLSTKYNVPFLDYSNDSICYDKKYFYNSMHMNIVGSKLFSEKLAHDLLRKNLITK